MGYRYGTFYFKQSPDGQGWDIFKDGSAQAIDWYGTTTGATNECRRRHIEALETENAALKAENVKLANSVDEMQHDFGVIAFCGLNMSKNDKESFRSEYSLSALQTLDSEHDRRITLENELRTSQGEIVGLLEYVKRGHCSSEDCADEIPSSAAGLELFNRLTELVTDSMAGEFLSGEVTRLEAELKSARECIKTLSPYALHERCADGGEV